MNNNVNKTSIPGMEYPTVQASLSGNPRDSAIASMNATNSKLTSLQSVGGRRKKGKYSGGNTGKIVVPQFNMLYNSVGGPGQTPNDIIKQNAIIGTQGAENAVFDKFATVKGGSGNSVYVNPNTNKYQWGCYSGGKKYRWYRKNKISRKSRKSRKSRRNRKSRKIRK